MDLQEYMSPQRFPETTQEGLEPKDQIMLDVMKYDMAVDYRNSGQEMNPKQEAVWNELREKLRYAPALTAELAQQGAFKSGEIPQQRTAPTPPSV